jgi:purine nucleoside permease
MLIRRVLAVLGVAATLAAALHAHAGPGAAGPRPFSVKRLILTTFDAEQEPILRHEGGRFDRTFRVPGAFAPLRCQSATGICVTVTGTTKSNAGPSTMALLRDPQLRFTARTLFIVDGIAGIRSSVGTLGTVGIADWVVDLDLGTHFVRPRNAPPHGWLPFAEYPQAAQRLNRRLARAAWLLTRDLPLADDATARAERAFYGEPEASDRPTVRRCDTGSSDGFWVGRDWADRADHIARVRIRAVDPDARLRCRTSQFEDAAIVAALARFGYDDQVVVVRAASDLEDQRPGETPRDLYERLAVRGEFAGFEIARENGARVALEIAHHLDARLVDR